MEERILKFSEVDAREDMQVRVLNTVHTHSVGIHKHDFFEFVYVVEGFTIHYFDGGTTFLTEGDIFYVPRGLSHGYAGLHYTKVYNCVFTEAALGEDYRAILALPGLCGLEHKEDAEWNRIRLSPPERLKVTGLLQRMYEEQEERESGWEILMRSMLAQFIISFSRYYEKHYMQDQTEKPHLSYIIKLLKYIEERYDRDIDLRAMSEYTGISADYLSRQFKGVMGLSPVAFLRNYRFARAMELMRAEPQLPMSVIAESVGYKYISHFSREFKAFTGISPSEFRHKFAEI